ncbi:hypothetical protein PoB_005907300 [Plakobranchus ocellatus]|uniref:Uncharacterized protein n=1 Tax=Plakobranchus ocellatus TaxID=259542 RepID=A0AAV4CLD9_9GAST|nr:hypothetical protein PoB_005907300 [Plakobranchus ocellatus]
MARGEAHGKTGVLSQALSQAVHGGLTVKCAADLHSWCTATSPKAKSNQICRDRPESGISIVPGTRGFHQVEKVDDFIIKARNLACFYDGCRLDKRSCCINKDFVDAYTIIKLKNSFLNPLLILKFPNAKSCFIKNDINSTELQKSQRWRLYLGPGDSFFSGAGDTRIAHRFRCKKTHKFSITKYSIFENSKICKSQFNSQCEAESTASDQQSVAASEEAPELTTSTPAEGPAEGAVHKKQHPVLPSTLLPCLPNYQNWTTVTVKTFDKLLVGLIQLILN